MYATYIKVQNAVCFNEFYYISTLQNNYVFKHQALSSSSITQQILLQLKYYSYKLPNLQIVT